MGIGERIVENLARVRERVDAACERVGRDQNTVTIIAVTKTQPAEVLNAVIAAGIEDLGENRIQEFLDKRDGVTAPCRWHMIGTLQRNKVTKAVGEFDLIHSVDSTKLADTIARISGERNVRTRVLLEVNTSGESSKHGFAAHDVLRAAEHTAALDNIELRGLMTIGPLTDDEGAVRRSFQSLFRLQRKVSQSIGRELPVVSMGMSDDFEIAIEEGATMIRLGRVLVGERR